MYKTATKQLVTSFKVTNGSASSSSIKQIEFARRGSSFLVSTADRIIRVYNTVDVLPAKSNKSQNHVSEPEPLQKLQDLVNRTLWKKCCFSGKVNDSFRKLTEKALIRLTYFEYRLAFQRLVCVWICSSLCSFYWGGILAFQVLISKNFK